MDFSSFTTRRKVDVLISFMDIQGFLGIARALPDAEQVFDLLDGWAAVLAGEIEKAGGRVIKFIGDACLAIFPDDRVDAGTRALLSAKEKAEAFFKEKGFSNRLKVTAHFGEAAVGPFGAGSCRSIDVLGDSVNVTSGLGRGDHPGRLVISPQAFRKLSAETRKLFHKYTPPIVYVASGG
jgi:class 3 adenylate cyclase